MGPGEKKECGETNERRIFDVISGKRIWIRVELLVLWLPHNLGGWNLFQRADKGFGLKVTLRKYFCSSLGSADPSELRVGRRIFKSVKFTFSKESKLFQT
ncbi:hypothetical protein TNIN_312871 [Trichonephila inaurata madagascariensis]|uniref:Uncharacterized protein n=1 Tax=Trichonephila inaurata madagascariensis TaxID=2747483 RepID=A0A8X6YM69_9ARAC|nr:hypothetical protein TNIN_312871 [Trichonephila inaurata madagascariensis]